MKNKVQPKSARGKAAVAPTVPTTKEAKQARDILQSLVVRLDAFIEQQRNNIKRDWTRDECQIVEKGDADFGVEYLPGGRNFLRMVVLAIEAADLARKHDLQVDGKHARKVNLVVRAIEALDLARWDIEPPPGINPAWFQNNLTREQWFTYAVGEACRRASFDSNGLGRIPLDAWKQAILDWRGMVRGTAGSRQNRGHPYSWHAVVFALLRSGGLTGAEKSKDLVTLLKQSEFKSILPRYSGEM